jgi:ATP-dependent helicase YprA (DUF1998 family)
LRYSASAHELNGNRLSNELFLTGIAVASARNALEAKVVTFDDEQTTI